MVRSLEISCTEERRTHGARRQAKKTTLFADRVAACELVASQEVVGWLLGVIFSMRSATDAIDVPCLLSRNKGAEMAVLRETLTAALNASLAHTSSPHGASRPGSAYVCNELLRALRVYFADRCRSSWFMSAPRIACGDAENVALTVDSFIRQVEHVVKHLANWVREQKPVTAAALGVSNVRHKKSCLSSEAQLIGQGTLDGLAVLLRRQATPQKTKWHSRPGAACEVLQTCAPDLGHANMAEETLVRRQLRKRKSCPSPAKSSVSKSPTPSPHVPASAVHTAAEENVRAPQTVNQGDPKSQRLQVPLLETPNCNSKNDSGFDLLKRGVGVDGPPSESYVNADSTVPHGIATDAAGCAEPKISLMQRIQRRASSYSVHVSTVPGWGVESQLKSTPAVASAQSELNVANTVTTTTDSSEVEWPDGNATCEACGRVTYDCEAWGKSGVILCTCCRSAKDPMLLAIARECMKITTSAVVDRS